ncbi:MAG TPA: type III PLP-dependent enzyme [Alphaproteobacteria bacterium]
MTIHHPNDRRTAPRTAGTRGFTSVIPRMNGTVDAVVADLKPHLPLYVMRPEQLARTAKEFTALFPGDVMYAVKCNPEKAVLQILYKNGVRSFDAASIEEVRLVAKIAPKAKIYFMHPVKSPEAIREAYAVHGVRAFVLDTKEELYKILQNTDLAGDLELFVRMALPKNSEAQIDFSAKFGVLPEDAIELLQQCRAVASKLGLSFHVGTQSTNPAVYAKAIDTAAGVVMKSGVKIDVLDVGGGFPVSYPGLEHPPLAQYMKVIAQAVKDSGLEGIPLICEPGRALVAASVSLVVRVEQRRGDLLYLNDGTYGGLYDASQWAGGLRYPVRMIRKGGEDAIVHPGLTAFSFAGPTCDSLDMMEGPFMLPADIRTGDWIEISNAGAYSQGLRSNFNGFGRALTVALYERSGAELPL